MVLEGESSFVFDAVFILCGIHHDLLLNTASVSRRFPAMLAIIQHIVDHFIFANNPGVDCFRCPGSPVQLAFPVS